MKITEVRTRGVQWKGETVPLPPHFCTNPMDVLAPMLTWATMGTFTFHGWLICEIFTDSGLVGIGNAALSPLVTKQLIDLHLKPLLIGADPWDIEFLWPHMLPLLEKFNLRWLEEPVIPDDLHGYAELKRFGRIPIAGGEHEHTLSGFRELIEAHAVDYIQFDTNRVGGLTQARKIAALAEAHQIPVIPHAGQMHNYHIVMASLNSPMAEFFPPVDVEVGNELFWYIFDGEPMAKGGYVDLDPNVPGLGLTVNEKALERFEVIE